MLFVFNLFYFIFFLLMFGIFDFLFRCGHGNLFDWMKKAEGKGVSFSSWEELLGWIQIEHRKECE